MPYHASNRRFAPIALLLTAILAVGQAAAAEQPSTNTAVVPAEQRGMARRHAEKVEAARTHKYQLLLVGDSITHNLDLPRFKPVWDQFYGPRQALGLGYSGARTENILWNLTHGELEHQSPKLVVLLIGTNNSDNANYPIVHTAEQIADGTRAIVALLRQRLPNTKILLLRIFPRTNVYKKKDGTERGDARQRFATNLRAGELVACLADGQMVHYLDVNHVFLRLDGSIDPAMMPDLLHPSPAGAIAWARAMEPKIAELLGDQRRDVPAEPNSALVPVDRLETDSYDWNGRHAAVLKIQRQLNPEVVMIGDSITHFWAGQPECRNQRGPQAWKELFGARPVLNMGFGWDRTQNVLWRIDQGELQGLRPRWVVINIGTNNFSQTKHARANTPEEVAQGIQAVVRRVRARSPESRIVVMGVLPRGPKPTDSFRAKITALNGLLAEQLNDVPGITFLDIGAKFLQPDGHLPRSLMSDFCHPTEQGYAIWAAALKPILAQ